MAQATVYLKTEEEYVQLNPDSAATDARRDVEAKTIKLFFEDNSEYPTILAIDESLTKQIPYTHISIGQGCLDQINDESCPRSYKQGYNRALHYGRLYNQAIAAHFDTGAKQRGQSDSCREVSNATSVFLGKSRGDARIVMELSDIHPLFGGRNITVNGDGKARLHIKLFNNTDGKFQSYEFNVQLELDDIHRLIAAFVDNDFLTLVLDETPELDPDTARPTLTLRNLGGESHRLTGWVIHRAPLPVTQSTKSPIDRFDSIYKEMLRIERRIQEAQNQQPAMSKEEQP